MTEAEREQQHVDDRAVWVASDRRAQQRVDARARAALVLLGGFLALVVLVALGLIAWQGSRLRENQEQIKALVREQQAQAQVVQEVLARQTANDRSRQALINRAIAAITAEQRRALVAHDRRTEALLLKTLRLTEQEVFGAGNQEARMGPLARLDPRPVPAPAPATRTAPVPRTAPAQPAPRPAPVPCKPQGKSGKCKG